MTKTPIKVQDLRRRIYLKALLSKNGETLREEV